MTFQQSIQMCFTKYFDFSGMATRAEYWWFILFLFLGGLMTAALTPIAYGLFSLVTLVPSLSAATRRLHDTGRSGWWQLILLVPLVGLIVLVVFLTQASREDVSAEAALS
jgi:uncharacterized membrane protein YhaH (DUF805 family)